MRPNGEVAERLIAPVLKTGDPSRGSWVRIPPSPPGILALDPGKGEPVGDVLGHSITYRVAMRPRTGQKVFTPGAAAAAAARARPARCRSVRLLIARGRERRTGTDARSFMLDAAPTANTLTSHRVWAGDSRRAMRRKEL